MKIQNNVLSMKYPILSIVIFTLTFIFHSSIHAASWIWTKSANSPSIEQSENQVGKAIDRDANGNLFVTGSISGKTFFSKNVIVTADAQSKDFFLAKYDSNGEAVWAFKGTSGTSLNHGDEEGLAVKCFGNDVYVTGYVSGSGKLEAKNGAFPYQSIGKRDILIAKYSSDGNLLWLSISGGKLDDQGVDIEVDSFTSDVAVVGEGRGNLTFGLNNLIVPMSKETRSAFVVMLDKSGNALWGKHLLGSQGSFAGGVAVAPSLKGGVFIGGNYQGNLIVDGKVIAASAKGLDGDMESLKDSQDIFGILLSHKGQMIWHRESQAGLGMEEVEAVARDKMDNFYLVGRYYPLGQNWTVMGEFGFGDKFLNVPQVSQVGGFCTSLTAQGDGRWINSVFVRDNQSFNVNGQELEYFSTSDYNLEDMSFNDVRVSDEGLVYVVGSFIRVARYDDLLDVKFDLVAGNWGLDPDGFVLVFDGNDVNGEFVTGSSFGQLPLQGELTTERDVAWGVAIHPVSGEAYLTGETFSKVCHFGPFVSVLNNSWQTQNQSDADLFLAKFLK